MQLSNILIMDQDRWDSLEYTYHQLMNALEVIILIRKDTFLVKKFQFNDIEVGQEYPLDKLQQFKNNIMFYLELRS